MKCWRCTAEEELDLLIDEYVDRFEEGPPILQIPGGPEQWKVLIRRALDRRSPITDSEIYSPPPDEATI